MRSGDLLARIKTADMIFEWSQGYGMPIARKIDGILKRTEKEARP